MNTYTGQVEAVIRATKFRSPTTYSWFGMRSPELPAAIGRALTPEAARDFLLYHLQSQLYRDYYCPGAPVSATKYSPVVSVPATSSMVDQLSQANSGDGFWADGWGIYDIEENTLVLRKLGVEVRARPEDCLTAEGDSIRPGLAVRVRFPKEYLNLSPGFYMANSSQWLTPADCEHLVRFYWNTTAGGAVQLMKSATSMLNVARVPFRLKALNDPGQFTRCDAVVLYGRKSDYGILSRILTAIYPEIARNLRPLTPALTKRLTLGLGFAEDPGGGSSFGQHRCQLLAEGLIRAYERGKQTVSERLQVVLECYDQAGLEFERPYLNPGSEDKYEFELEVHAKPKPILARNGKQKQANDMGTFLSVATQIGRHLSREAIWYEGQCNWIGAHLSQDAKGSNYGLAYKALGPDLRTGTAGVALFMAELYKVNEDLELRNTALGAIRQAMSCAGLIAPIDRLGLYMSWPGIALVAARIGILLGEDALLENARHLIKRCIEGKLPEYEFDLTSGSAGAIVALVTLAEVLDDSSLTGVAIQLANELLQSAGKSDAGFSWRSATFKHPRNLTGFSHGTAGVAYALLELYNATRDEQYRQAANLAFAYERSHFDPVEGNWPDFRDEPGRIKRGRQYRQFMSAWCHGAPGIALSRLRAYELLGDETCKTEALIALRTTRKMLQTTLDSRLGNYSLCHGMAGNAEILRYGEQVLGRDCHEERDVALDVANKGIANYWEDPRSWPGGVQGGENPSLMLGLAGVGYFYLRLYNPATPSVLLFRREEFSPQPGRENEILVRRGS